jgi:hypothetical protein
MQFLLVDLRCHGDSASIKKRGPHTVASTALDVLKLVSSFCHRTLISKICYWLNVLVMACLEKPAHTSIYLIPCQ